MVLWTRLPLVTALARYNNRPETLSEQPSPLLLGNGKIPLRSCILTDTKRLILVEGAHAPPLNLQSSVSERDDS